MFEVATREDIMDSDLAIPAALLPFGALLIGYYISKLMRK